MAYFGVCPILLDTLRIKEITQDQNYYNKVIYLEKWLREIPLTDKETDILIQLEKELDDRGYKIEKQYYVMIQNITQ